MIFKFSTEMCAGGGGGSVLMNGDGLGGENGHCATGGHGLGAGAAGGNALIYINCR